MNFLLLKSYLVIPNLHKILIDHIRIINYRLNRDSKSVKCDFANLRVFETLIIAYSESTVIFIIKCYCIFHNYMRKTKDKLYESQNIKREK